MNNRQLDIARQLYEIAGLKDACYDADPEIHRVLSEKIFPAQPTVPTVDAFITEQGE